MRSAVEGRKPARRYAVMRALAPHVDEAWAESFAVELRLLGIEGARVGAALSEVESHCIESGQSAEEAFGDSFKYARSLHLPADGEHSIRAVLFPVAPVIVQILGMFLLNGTFSLWLRGQQLEITTGHLVNAAVLLLGVVGSLWFADSVLRMAVYHRVLSVLLLLTAMMASTAICVVALLFLDTVTWRGSSVWGLALGTAALVGGVVWAFARLRAHGSGEDPISSPFEMTHTSSGNESAGSPQRLFKTSLFGTLTYTALIPSGTVLLFVMTYLVYKLSPA